MTSDRSGWTQEDLREVQELLLRAVLRGEMLPGSRDLTAFPDLRFVMDQPEIVLSDENLAGRLGVEDAPRPVRVAPRSELLERGGQEDRVYLRFGPPQSTGDTVMITLEARIVSGDPGRHALGLGGIQVRFQRVGSSWQVVQPPEAFAT